MRSKRNGASASEPSKRRPSASRCSPSRNRSGMRASAVRRDRAERVVGQELADRCDLDRADLLGRELRRRRELAEPLDLVAPVLEPHRPPRDAREHVDDATPNGELPPVLDDVDPDVAELREPFRERVRRELHAGRELDRSGACLGSGASPASRRGTGRRGRTVLRRRGGARRRRPSGPRPRAPGRSPRTAARPTREGARRGPVPGRRRSRGPAPPLPWDRA